MELYVLDDQRRRVEVIDRFESLIWTDRVAEMGDFEIVLPYESKFREMLKEDGLVAVNESDHVMVITTIEASNDAEGKHTVTITGRSLESILEDRIARGSLADLTTAPRWGLAQTPANLVRHIFTQICIYGVLDPNDIIPNVSLASFYKPSTIPESTQSIKVELEPTSLYTAIKELCFQYNLGFGLVRNPLTSMLHFIVYAGNNRTSSQTAVLPTVFSPTLDNLVNTKSLSSSAEYKNVAYVIAPEGAVVVYADNAARTAKGFAKKSLIVNVSSIRGNPTEDSLSLVEVLTRRGQEALAEHRRVKVFDGEVPKTGHKYRIDYDLGDLVEMQEPGGLKNVMRVTEQIFVSDAEGDRSYPTLVKI